ncbi:hypothetical protein [Paracidovorax wautersii]|uniref:Uncharacterized protein n=1 Tax=Paracidovorax wautersii TaxID=1177982 RepID=A0ABU1IG76_9BURK|nr:hypothetical protein [Paracidovorax wautersii]MDR6216226.1 hypothetical protein [Paracidovorax wautersii]
MSITRSVELPNGHDVSVTLSRAGFGFQIEEIDLEIHPYRTIESPDGGPYRSEAEALRAAEEIATRALRLG